MAWRSAGSRRVYDGQGPKARSTFERGRQQRHLQRAWRGRMLHLLLPTSCFTLIAFIECTHHSQGERHYLPLALDHRCSRRSGVDRSNSPSSQFAASQRIARCVWLRHVLLLLFVFRPSATVVDAGHVCHLTLSAKSLEDLWRSGLDKRSPINAQQIAERIWSTVNSTTL
jgi:hypothetical protein